jgi:hypothetical protein
MASGAPVVGGAIATFLDDDTTAVDKQGEMPERHSTTFADEPALWIPWWFFAYMFSRRFLETRSLEFPDLRLGEDPVFLARALTSAEAVTLTS